MDMSQFIGFYNSRGEDMTNQIIHDGRGQAFIIDPTCGRILRVAYYLARQRNMYNGWPFPARWEVIRALEEDYWYSDEYVDDWDELPERYRCEQCGEPLGLCATCDTE